MMDEIFIKMSWKAWEYLEDHIPHEIDDLWCDGHSVFIRMPVIVNGWIREGEFVDHVKYKLKEPFECEEFIVLGQEDLQEIAMNFLINKVLDEDFEAKGFGFEWMKREYGFNLVDDTFGLWYNGYVSVQNYNQLWLCFVMETCYNKRWNSEQGVWEVIG